ncbi:MAG: hypothetical protein IPK08_05030 [Bacteroidetes bacterium]|nr:hypothetical protein [Bacteroidota bacterium]
MKSVINTGITYNTDMLDEGLNTMVNIKMIVATKIAPMIISNFHFLPFMLQT